MRFEYETVGIMVSSWLRYEYDDGVATLDCCGNGTHYEIDASGRAVPGSTPWEPMSSSAPKEHLTGKMYDNVTGLYYFHARWYDPEVGRFVSRDTAASIQQYHFCSNDPTTCFDPDGHWGRSVHDDYTYRMALGYFDHTYAARQIAFWDDYTDRNPATWPVTHYRPYHFDEGWAHDRMLFGCITCDVREFGTWLHTIQDHHTHGRFPRGHWPLKWPDDEHDPRNLNEWDATRRSTRSALRTFRCFCWFDGNSFRRR